MIELTHNPIDTNEVLAQVRSPQAGAAVLFIGTTREWTGDRRTVTLDYECYPEMAAAKLTELKHEAESRWPLIGCAIVHRLGRVDLDEISIAIAVSSAHRRPAFEAGEWLIDRIKEVVPIWKQEHWSDGETEWVHPSGATAERQDSHEAS